MRFTDALTIGIDIGTGGARAVAVSTSGTVVASARKPLSAVGESGPGGTRHQQDPNAWWEVVCKALRELSHELAEHGAFGLSVAGTSGTIVGIDASGRPTTPGLMYDDARAQEEANELNALAREAGGQAGFSPSSPLAKLRWIEKHLPEEFARTRHFVHQADFVAGRLTGALGESDYSNALKMGYDLEREAWPDWFEKLSTLHSKLPRVMAPGASMGSVCTALTSDLGLPSKLAVFAGATDGTAGFLASGATRVGDDNTTLGTTLVFKRLADHRVVDPQGLIYCHKLPGGLWIPGAASNTGGAFVRSDFHGADLSQLDAQAQEALPSEHLAYPLRVQGERFPFAAPTARGFCEPEPADERVRYAALLQGTAFIERLGYETLDRHTGRATGDVYATGGGSRSDVWMQLRADVSGRVYHRPEFPESAFGSAILAAAAACQDDLSLACRRMVHLERSFHPDPARTDLYTEYYDRFLALLGQRGLLQEPSP